MAESEVTLGEVYRAVLRVEVQALKTNGRLQLVEQKQAVGFERLDAVDDRLDRLEKVDPPKPDDAPKKRTGLTVSISGASAVAAWEVAKKLLGL